MIAKLIELRDRLAAAQRKLLIEAAEANLLPSDNALRRIADLENTLAAIDVLIAEQQDRP